MNDADFDWLIIHLLSEGAGTSSHCQRWGQTIRPRNQVWRCITVDEDKKEQWATWFDDKTAAQDFVHVVRDHPNVCASFYHHLSKQHEGTTHDGRLCADRIGWMGYITCFCLSRGVLAILMWRKKQHHMQEYLSIEMVAWSGTGRRSGHSCLTISFILHDIKRSSWCHLCPGDHIPYFRMKL